MKDAAAAYTADFVLAAEAIDAALAACAPHVLRRTAAYYFRYLASVWGEDSPLLQAMLEQEIELGELGLIQPLGRRWVAGTQPF